MTDAPLGQIGPEAGGGRSALTRRGVRARYASDHWARREPTEGALADYLEVNRAVYNRTKVTLLERLLGRDLQGRRVLDYGGGAGFVAVRCAQRGARVTLVDAEANALATAQLLAQQRGVTDRVELLQADEFPRELATRRFDIVIVKDVVEHLPDDVEVLWRLGRCQEPGGRLLLSTQSRLSLNYLIEGTYRRRWCGETDWCGWDPTHLRFYTPRSLRMRLAAAGYVARRWAGLYIIPYDILSWLVLLKRNIVLEGLHHFDLWFGRTFPFNRLGWNVMVEAERRGGDGLS